MLTPKKICEEVKKKVISKHDAFALLISLIENSDNEDIRLDSLKRLEKIGLFNEILFNIIESMLISDSNAKIRNTSAKLIQKKFLDNALEPLKWALRHETDYKCLITIIQSLEKINNIESKLVLFDETKKIMKIKYLNKNKGIENKKFKKTIKKFLKNKKFDKSTNQELAEILINFLTIHHLTKQYPNVYFEIELRCGLVNELDLSDYLEYEVKGTPFGWKNNISSITEISCIKYLKQLKKIDLSNNQIENIKELTQLQNLTHLVLKNNKIEEKINLKYLKSFTNLQYLDLRDNNIAKKLVSSDFDLKTKVILNDSYIRLR